MGRTARDNRPYVKPVEKVELSEKHFKLRAIVAVILFVVGLAAIAFGINSFLNPEDGWTEIEVSASSKCKGDSNELMLLYNIGASGTGAKAEHTLVTSIYTESMERICFLLDSKFEYENIKNLYYINQHPNEVIEIDEVLYNVFSSLKKYENRTIYLGPIFSYYEGLFALDKIDDTYSFDPNKNGELKQLFEDYCEYINNPDMVNIELLGDNKIMLKVSPEYKNFYEANYGDRYLDMVWLKNAFVVDYVANVLIEGGHTLGTISSIDGYCVSLDDSDTEFNKNIFGAVNGNIYSAGFLKYNGKISMCALRSFESEASDSTNYYTHKDNTVVTSYVDPKDGLSRSSVLQLVCYSDKFGCADIALMMAPIYISDSFDEALIKELKHQGIESVYAIDNKIYYTDKDASISDIYKDDNVMFDVTLITE